MLPNINDGVILAIAATSMLSFLAMFFIVYSFLYQKRMTDMKLTTQESELKRRELLTDKILNQEDLERKKLSEEIHDGIAAKLSGIKFMLEHVLSNQPAQSENKNLLNNAINNLNTAIEETRQFARHLQPLRNLDKGILKAAEIMIDEFNSYNKTKFIFQKSISKDFSISKSTEVHLLRIIAECLNNINKHAYAQNASVQISVQDNEINILIEDDGVGFDESSNQNGLGINNIKGRVQFLNGLINIDSSINGTTIVMSIPLKWE